MVADFIYADSGAATGSQLFRLFGDATGDRVVNAADLTLFRNVFGSTTSDITFDVNGDGVSMPPTSTPSASTSAPSSDGRLLLTAFRPRRRGRSEPRRVCS